jgi:hypothetical protein
MSLAWSHPTAPVRCEVCCPPQGCNYQQYFGEAMQAHVTPTNQMYETNQEASEQQLLTAAAAMTAFAEAPTSAAAETKATSLIVGEGETAFLNTIATGQNEYTQGAAFGNVVPQEWMTNSIGLATLAQKEALWDVIANGGGVKQVLLDYAESMVIEAHRIGGTYYKPKRQILPAPAYFSTLEWVGGAIGVFGLVTGDPALALLGALIAFGGTTGNWAVALGGC